MGQIDALLLEDQTYYDTECRFLWPVDTEVQANLVINTSDPEKAIELMGNVWAGCNDGEDQDCLLKGSRWSKIYMMNTFMLGFTLFQMICLCLGTVRPWFNFFATICGPWIWLANVIVFFISLNYYNSDHSDLCKITLKPTSYSRSIDEAPTNDTTFESDAAGLYSCLMVQVFTCCGCSCCAGLLPSCKEDRIKLRDYRKEAAKRAVEKKKEKEMKDLELAEERKKNKELLEL